MCLSICFRKFLIFWYIWACLSFSLNDYQKDVIMQFDSKYMYKQPLSVENTCQKNEKSIQNPQKNKFTPWSKLIVCMHHKSDAIYSVQKCLCNSKYYCIYFKYSFDNCALKYSTVIIQCIHVETKHSNAKYININIFKRCFERLTFAQCC